MKQPTNAAHARALHLHNRAAKSQAAGEAVRPEKLYLQALALKEQLFGPRHLEVGFTLNNLGLFYKTAGKLVEARRCYERALPILEKELGGSDVQFANALYNFAQLLRKEADEMEQRSQWIEEGAAEIANESWRETVRINEGCANYRLTVLPSRIHRLGVFAGERIRAASDVIEYTGERVPRSEWEARSRNRTYLCSVNRNWCVDGAVGGSGAELINHCCEPNCKFVRRNGRVWVVSMRAIKPGEELLIDYSFSDKVVIVRCYCGAPTCRGTINRRHRQGLQRSLK